MFVACHVMSSTIMWCHVITRDIKKHVRSLSCSEMSCHVMSSQKNFVAYLVIHCHIMSSKCHFATYPRRKCAMLNSVMPSIPMQCRVIHCHIMSCQVVSKDVTSQRCTRINNAMSCRGAQSCALTGRIECRGVPHTMSYHVVPCHPVIL